MNTKEIINLKGSTWLIPGPTNIGLYETSNGCFLIDSGNDKESGRKIRKILNERKWNLIGIINTHSNADHIGGNDYLQRLYNCRIFSTFKEKAFIESPKIEASFLWGGFPIKELNNKFFEAKPSEITDVINENSIIHSDLQIISFPGHFFEMIGVKTKDNVCFLGDCILGDNVLNKYKIPFMYDVDEYKKTINKISQIAAEYFVISHGEVVLDITSLATKNLFRVQEIESKLLEILKKETNFDIILKEVCDFFLITLDSSQQALVGNTIKSFLSYLYNEKKITYKFIQNTMLWSVFSELEF